ncbi:unnamed protein product [Rotaria socialis]|uniref:Uncharacterized protein n=1 Tax=Rotaria socialis TaxID=392032 RepID=A0A821WWS4_9BILA|nr:unnamed protein product [Rotaria socialis]
MAQEPSVNMAARAMAQEPSVNMATRAMAQEPSEYIELGPLIHVNLQAGSLHNGINLHLTSAVQNRQPHRLDVRVIDSQGVRLRAVHWVTLSHTGLIVTNNPRNFNTLYLEVAN